MKGKTPWSPGLSIKVKYVPASGEIGIINVISKRMTDSRKTTKVLITLLSSVRNSPTRLSSCKIQATDHEYDMPWSYHQNFF